MVKISKCHPLSQGISDSVSFCTWDGSICDVDYLALSGSLIGDDLDNSNDAPDFKGFVEALKVSTFGDVQSIPLACMPCYWLLVVKPQKVRNLSYSYMRRNRLYLILMEKSSTLFLFSGKLYETTSRSTNL